MVISNKFLKNWTNCKMVNWGTLYVTLGFFFFFFLLGGRKFVLFVWLFFFFSFLFFLAPPIIIISTYLAVLFSLQSMPESSGPYHFTKASVSSLAANLHQNCTCFLSSDHKRFRCQVVSRMSWLLKRKTQTDRERERERERERKRERERWIYLSFAALASKGALLSGWTS